MNSKQANISANFEKQIMNLLKKNKLTGFRSGAAAREAMMGGGVGGAVGLADAMKDDSSGNVPADDKMSHYLKSILGYGTAGAGVGAGFGLKKGLRLKNQAAKSHLKDLLPGIEKELATGVDPTLMGEARKRVLKQIEEHHPAMDYETFMENLANEKAHAPTTDKKPGFFERRDIKRESGKAKQKADVKARDAASEAEKAIESNLTEAKNNRLIKDMQQSKASPSAVPESPKGPFQRLSTKDLGKAVPPVSPPENEFVKMYREAKDSLNSHGEAFSKDPSNAVHLANMQATTNHLKDIERFTHAVHAGDMRTAQKLHPRIFSNHGKLVGGQNIPSSANSAATPAVTALSGPATANSSQGFQSFGSMLGQLTGKP